MPLKLKMNAHKTILTDTHARTLAFDFKKITETPKRIVVIAIICKVENYQALG